MKCPKCHIEVKTLVEVLDHYACFGETIEGKHILFVPGPAKPKTKTWWVVNKHDDIALGSIEWFARWRGYGFYPKPDTVYEQDCLRDIALFVEAQTKLHREARKQRVSTGQEVNDEQV